MVFLFTIILTDNAFALRINEIEANPDGEDSGFEWIELYSEDSINLEGYSLDHEGRGSIINLSGNFEGFFIVDFNNQWLRNSNETVYLKFNGEIVDTIGPFSDNKNGKTYSLCGSEWRFTDSTKEEENSCGTNSKPKENNTKDNKENNNLEDKKEITKTVQNLTIPNLKNEILEEPSRKIILGSKNQEETITYKTRIAVIYSFIGLCVLLVILLALRKL